MLTKLIVAVPLFVLAFSVSVADADHAWGPYHWGRTANPFTIQLGDNVSTNWDKYLRRTASDWSSAPAFNASVVTGKAKPRTCAPVAGRVEVCSEKYGNNGWLGLAQVWVDGDHIIMGTVKMNDSYFNTPSFNTAAWRNLVMCQEVAHVFGLDHQDEDFTNENLGTCTDYTNDPSTNQYPNQHDYDMLAQIYDHTDERNTMLTKAVATTPKGNRIEANIESVDSKTNYDDVRSWGKEVRRDSKKHGSLHSRDIGNGMKVFTFVTWAE